MKTVTTPAVAPPARLGALAKLPIFLDLSGRRVAVVGGGEPVTWKAELLAAAGAQIDLYAPDPEPDLEALAARLPAITFHRRTWRPVDLDGAALVVGDPADDGEAGRLREAARARNLLLNAIDQPAFCDFQFGTIVNRSPVVIGIMTDGAAPILGQAIRRRIEAVVPAQVAGWARTAKAFRDRLKALLPSRRDRRVFWERFVDTALSSGEPDGDRPAALERLARSVGESGGSGPGRVGEVVIVGAGPGDPELLTLKAMRELQAADVIVYDRLVTPEILELGRREARRVHAGKEGHGAACRQEDICALLVDLALAGERVVRLKGGDPAVFGRTGEEVAACRDAGVPVRIVPGITTASAATAALGGSLTHRDHARRVVFLTGHDRTGDLPADLDLRALADPGATLVVYMGRRTVASLAKGLMAEGLPALTPAVALSDVSRPGMKVSYTNLVGLVSDYLDLPEGRPVIIMIGDAVARRTAGGGANGLITSPENSSREETPSPPPRHAAHEV